MSLKTVAISLLMLIYWALAGCGDEDRRQSAAQESNVVRGRIVAPIISGMKYQSGSQSGVTDSDGFFTFEQGVPVHFFGPGFDFPPVSIEAVLPKTIQLTSAANADAAAALLNARAQFEATIISNGGYVSPEPVPPPPPPHPTITLSDILNSHQKIVKAAKIIWVLDSDGDTSNGVQISPAMQAASVAPIDLDSSDIEAAATPLRNTILAIDGKVNSWKSDAEVTADLDARRRCAFTGVYTGTMKLDTASETDLKWGFMTAVSSPPFGDVTGFILKNSDALSSESLFHYETAMDGAQVNPNVSAALYSPGDDWPEAALVSGAPQMNLSVNWNVTDKLTGTWGMDSSNGAFDMTHIPNVTNRNARFAARWRFVYSPVHWETDDGKSKYGVLLVEIDGQGKVSASIFDPRPGPYVFQVASMNGNLSPYSDFMAIETGSWTGAEEWRFEAYFDRPTLTIKTPYIYQTNSRGLFLADDLQGNQILGCAL